MNMFPLLFPVMSTLLIAISAALMYVPVLAVWDAVATKYIKDLYVLCARLYFNTDRLPQYMRCWGLLIFAVFIVFGPLLQIWPIMLMMVYFIYILPRLILKYLVKRQQILIRDQLVSAISIMTNSTRAGLSIEEATDSVAKEAPAPLCKEFRRIIGEYRHGRPFNEALEDAKNRLNLTCFTLFSSTLVTNKIYGGNSNVTLERLRKSLLENQRLERKLESDTASAQMVITLLAIFPLFFLFFSYLMNPQGTQLLFTSIVGQFIVTIAMIVVYIGYRWGQKILDVTF